MTDIARNLETIKANIARAAERSGRSESDIDLLVVTKTIPVERMKIVEDLGIYRFGENRVQEFLKKCDFFTKKTSWDIIGRLQSNKVKYIIDNVNLVHSLCTKSTATEMQRLCLVKDTYIDCLVEVNVGEESSKDVRKEYLTISALSLKRASQSRLSVTTARVKAHCLK